MNKIINFFFAGKNEKGEYIFLSSINSTRERQLIIVAYAFGILTAAIIATLSEMCLKL